MRKTRSRLLKESLLSEPHDDVEIEPWGGARAATASEPIPQWDEMLLREQLARDYAFLGEDGMQRVREAYVVVAGVGGVGSWAATMLVRNGVSRIRLIDFDQVTLSSLNRHAVATLDDVGRPKVSVMRRYLQRVAPWAVIDEQNTLLTTDNVAELLADGPSFVVDAIDNIATKVELLYYCYTHKIPVISSMGSGCKADTSRMNINDISMTTEDPLSRATRRRLKAKGVLTGIPVVFSTEKPDPRKASLLPLDDEVFARGKADEMGVLPDFRARILPVLGPMPGIAGLSCAAYVLTTLAGYPMEPLTYKARTKQYNDIVSNLTVQSLRLGEDGMINLDADDVGFVMDEIYRGRSVLPPHHTTRCTLTRWDAAEPLSILNVVAMTRDEAKQHEKVLMAHESPKKVYPEAVLNLVASRTQEIRDLQRWRE